MKRILSLILLILIVASCNQDEYIIEYPTTFVSTKISNQNIRVFTKKGEIKDSKITSELINRIKDKLTDVNNLNVQNEISVTYLSSTGIELNTINPPETQELNLHETPNITYWERKNVSKAVIGVYDYNANHYKYQPLYFKILGVNALINSTLFESQECLYAKKKGKAIVMPFLDFYHKGKKDFYNYEYGVNKINNSFVSESFSKLGINDTIVVQEYNVELNIKN